MALKGINAYKKGSLKQDIATADPHKLTLMLLQGAIDRIAYAKGAMDRKDMVEKANFISKASAIIIHLRDTLDMETGGDLSQNLYSLYSFMVERLTDAHVNNDLKVLDEVSSLLSPIRDAWVQIPEEAKQEAYEAQRQKRQAV